MFYTRRTRFEGKYTLGLSINVNTKLGGGIIQHNERKEIFVYVYVSTETNSL